MVGHRQDIVAGNSPVGVLISGAGSDIGKVLVKHLSRHDDLKLLLTTHSNACEPPASNTERIRIIENIDLTSPEDVSKVVCEATELFKGPFGIVHSVGTFWKHVSIDKCGIREAREMIESHYLSLYGLLNQVIPLMKARHGGRIVAFSCTSVGFHYPEMAAFSSAKAAVECLIQCVANEWSKFGISANAIALSTIATPKVMKSKPLASEEKYVTPEELSLVVEDVLLSRSPYLSGNVIRPLKHSDTFYNRSYFDRNPHGN